MKQYDKTKNNTQEVINFDIVTEESTIKHNPN